MCISTQEAMPPSLWLGRTRIGIHGFHSLPLIPTLLLGDSWEGKRCLASASDPRELEPDEAERAICVAQNEIQEKGNSKTSQQQKPCSPCSLQPEWVKLLWMQGFYHQTWVSAWKTASSSLIPSVIFMFISLFFKYLLSSSCVSGTVVGPGIHWSSWKCAPRLHGDYGLIVSQRVKKTDKGDHVRMGEVLWRKEAGWGGCISGETEG